MNAPKNTDAPTNKDEQHRVAVMKALGLFGGRVVMVDKESIYSTITFLINKHSFADHAVSERNVRKAVGSLYARKGVHMGYYFDRVIRERMACLKKL